MNPTQDISTIYNDLRKVNGNHEVQLIPKGKIKLKTISWQTAVKYAKAYDPAFNYSFGDIKEHQGKDGITCSTTCTITLCGHTRDQFYPVNDKSFNILYNPTAQEINDSIVRAIPKALALHFGLFAYLYNGMDTPEEFIKSTSAFSASIKNTVPTTPNDEGAGVTIPDPFSEGSISSDVVSATNRGQEDGGDPTLSIVTIGFGKGEKTYLEQYGDDMEILKKQISFARDNATTEEGLIHYKALIATYKKVA